MEEFGFNFGRTSKCPKCGTNMVELSEEDMTEGQQISNESGFNVPFYCPNCKYYGIHDTTSVYDYDDEDYDDFEYDGSINDKVIEDLIDRAIEKRCFIEVLSLVHNVIELYLKVRIKKHLFKLHDLNELGVDESRRIEDDDTEVPLYTVGQTKKEELVRRKFELLFNSKKHLHDYKELCFTLNLIDEKMYSEITAFNKERNSAIHNLLKENKPNEEDMKYSQIINAAKRGRVIQLKLSPLNHSENDIKIIIKKFDIAPEEAEDDPFLK